MSAGSAVDDRPTQGWSPERWRRALALVALFTVAVRSVWCGDPIVDADEQFYLLVGDRWLHGAIPYVDIWDRKPPGLFLLYALIRLLGGDGVLQYQLVAAGFVAATAMLIAVIARRIASPAASIVAALSYPLMLGWSGGMGGQSPIFYNLPMALAALLVLRTLRRDGGHPTRTGAFAMLLVGVAMQIKYSAVFEGVYFGLVLLWLALKRHGWARAAALGALWIAVAVGPTALAFAAFVLAGHGEAFAFANFTSILLRPNEPLASQAHALGKILARLSPALIALAFASSALARGGPTHRFVFGWFCASLFGVLVFGNFFNHYALPLMVPLAIAIAPAFTRRTGVALAALVLIVNGVAYAVTWRHILARSGDRAYAGRLVGVIRSHLHGGSLYVYNGEPILYHLTGSPLPTRWPFPYHLSFTREAPALGVRPTDEVRAIMDRRPTVVVDTYDPTDLDIDPTTRAIVRSRLARDYRLVASFRLLSDERRVYALNDLSADRR